MNFINFLLLLIIFVALGVFCTRRSPAGVKFFWTLVGIASLIVTILIIFVNIYNKVNAPIFFGLLYLLIAVGAFLVVGKFRLW